MCDTVARLTTPLPPDSVSLLDVLSCDGAHVEVDADHCDGPSVSQTALIGTYALQEDQAGEGAVRKGAVHLVTARKFVSSPDEEHDGRYTTHQEAPHRPQTAFSLSEDMAVSLPAVLDLAAVPVERQNFAPHVVYAACADGSIAALSARQHSSNEDPNIDVCFVENACEPNTAAESVLNLSAHVCRHPASCQELLLAVSDSRGDVTVRCVPTRGVQDEGDASVSARWRAHQAEAWSVCGVGGVGQGGATRDVLFVSGGDDGALVANAIGESQPVWRLRQPHGGVGVTTVATRPGMPYELWTGGYDDTVCVWDVRAMRKRPMASVGVAGGVWRLRFHPSRRDIVLVAAMYAGFKVVGVPGGVNDDDMEIAAEYNGHESIAYGAEWLGRLSEGGRGCGVALTASFYDRAVCLWTFDDGRWNGADDNTYEREVG